MWVGRKQCVPDRRERSCREGRARERARGPPCPSPARRPCRPPIQILHPGSIAGQGEEAGGVWVGRKQCVCGRRGARRSEREREREKREFLAYSKDSPVKIGWERLPRAPRARAGSPRDLPRPPSPAHACRSCPGPVAGWRWRLAQQKGELTREGANCDGELKSTE